MNVPLKTTHLFLMCSTALVSPDKTSFTFTMGGTHYYVDASIFKAVLNLPASDFVNNPSSDDLAKFFSDIHYTGVMDLNRLNKNLLVAEWYCFFDTLAKVFANCSQKNFNIITFLLQNIDYAIVYNRRIDIGKLLWGVIMNRIIVAKRSFDRGAKIHCYYPHFLTRIFNQLVSSEL